MTKISSNNKIWPKCATTFFPRSNFKIESTGRFLIELSRSAIFLLIVRSAFPVYCIPRSNLVFSLILRCFFFFWARLWNDVLHCSSIDSILALCFPFLYIVYHSVAARVEISCPDQRLSSFHPHLISFSSQCSKKSRACFIRRCDLSFLDFFGIWYTILIAFNFNP